MTQLSKSSVLTDQRTLSIQYIVQGACILILQLLIVLVIILVYDSRAVSDSIESVQRTNPILTNRTSFKRYIYSLRLLFRAIRTIKTLIALVLCSGLILINRQVSEQVGFVFVACSVAYVQVSNMIGHLQQLLRRMRRAGLVGLLKLGLGGLYRWTVIQGAGASEKQRQGRFLLYRHQSIYLQHQRSLYRAQ